MCGIKDQPGASREIIIVFVLSLCAMATGADFAGGTGEPNDPYQIATAEQLIAVGQDLGLYDKHFVLVADLDLDPGLPGGRVFDHAVIAPDVNEAESGFQGTPFTGRLDGQNHTIGNLTICDAKVDCLGLFGKLGRGSGVVAIDLVDVQIGSRREKVLYIGAVAGCAEGGHIEHCRVSGQLASTGRAMGGLVGQGTETRFVHCHTDCAMDTYALPRYGLGGIIASSTDAALEDCSSNVTIDTHDYGAMYVGGLIGADVDGQLARCSYTGSIVADGTGSHCIGGLIGRSEGGALLDCQSTGSVLSRGTGAGPAGGIVGQILDGTVRACHSTGYVHGGATGVYDIGGLIGSCVRSEVDTCCSTGSTSGHATGVGPLGGLIGGSVDSRILRCFALNSITVGGTSCDDIGGLVGLCEGGTIEACYAIAALDASRASNVGGLIGRISHGDVSACYAASQITTERSDYIGGLVGNNSGTVTQSLWDVQASGCALSEGGLGFATAQMMDASCYALNGWAGHPDWLIRHGQDYPRLAWEGALGQPVPEPEVAWFDGQGTAEAPYLISSADQLDALGMASILWNKHFVLVSDVNLAGVELRPIGVWGGMGFKGLFDGNGHIIRHLSLDAGPREIGDYGLFGCIDGEGIVCRLGLENVDIVTGETVAILAPLVGYNKGSIHDCYVTGTIATRYSCPDCLGGFAGVNTGTISDCYAQTSMSGQWYGSMLGGFVGLNREGTIVSCYATGSIQYQTDRNVRDGGLVGSNSGTVIWSFWDTEAGLCPASDGGMGLTTSEMKDAAVLALNGWAADDSWLLDEGNDYPRLVWQGTPGQPIPSPTTKWIEGAGTTGDPYRIVNSDQLFRLGQAAVLWDKCFRLESNLDLDGRGLPVIGLCGNWGFRGVFAGSGRTIRGLSMAPDDGRTEYLGLFGAVAVEGLVTDVTLEEVQLTVPNGGHYVGSLAGWNEGVIARCLISGTLTVEAVPDHWSDEPVAEVVGGLVGCNAGDLVACRGVLSIQAHDGVASLGGLVGCNRGSMRDCQATGEIVGVKWARQVGGLVGSNEQGIVRGGMADVSLVAGLGAQDIGGLVGTSSGILSRCRCGGSLTLEYPPCNVGGLAGQSSSGWIESCYAACPVSATDSARNLGGLIGFNGGALIANCYAVGSIDAGERTRTMGSLAGYNSAAVAYSYTTSAISCGAESEQIGGLLAYDIGVVRSSFEFSQDDMNSDLVADEFSDWDFYGDDGDGLRDPWFSITGRLPVLSWEAEETGLIPVPDLHGLSLESARDVLSSVGLAPGEVRADYHETCPAGTVAYVIPSDLAAMGSLVNIVMSAGPYDWADNSGAGTHEAPYRIASAGHLASLGSHPELWSHSFQLAAEIDLRGVVFDRAPIAGNISDGVGETQRFVFEGRFDGMGYAIRGLTIDAWDVPCTGLGLFGAIGPRGEVVNVEMADAEILCGGPSKYVGIVAGSNAGVVRNCLVSGVIVSGAESSYLGGCVGINSEGTIDSCHAQVLAVGGHDYVGGVAGSDSGTIVESSATGAVVEDGRGFNAATRLTADPRRRQRTVTTNDFNDVYDFETAFDDLVAF